MALTTSQQQDILRLGVSMFNASVGVSNATLLAASFPTATSTATVALYDAIAASSIFQDQRIAFSSVLSSDATFIAAYAAQLGISGTALTTATSFATGFLATAGNTRGGLMLAATNFLASSAALTDTTFGGTAALFQNRVAVANDFTFVQGGGTLATTSLATLQATLSLVTSATTSVATAIAANSTTATAGSTFTLTTGIDNVTSAFGTVNGVIDQAGGTGNTTWGLSDTVATSANGTFNLTLLSDGGKASAGFNTTGVTTLNIKSVDQATTATANSFDVAGLAGATTVNIANSSVVGTTADTLTVSSLAAGSTLGINTNGQFLNVTAIGKDWTGSADTLKVNVAGRDGALLLGTGVETVAITSSGTGARLASLTSQTTATNKTVTVAGTDLKIDGVMDNTITSFDASTATGAINVYLSPGSKLTSAKGGTGTADVLAVDTLSTTQTLAGFEKLVAEVAATYDLTNAVGVTVLGADVGSGAISFTNAAATQNTLSFSGADQRTTAPAATGNLTFAGTVGYALKTSSGSADALTIAVDNGGTATTGTATVATGAITANGIENITITEANWKAITFTGIIDGLTTGSNLAFKASGASNLALGVVTVTSGLATGTNTFDFSGQTGTLSATVVAAASNLTWTAGTGVEKITTSDITSSTGIHTYTMGNAANVVTITTLTANAGSTLNVIGGTGEDTFTFTTVNNNADIINIDGGTSTSTSQNMVRQAGTGQIDTIDSMKNIQLVNFEGTGTNVVNATVASGYADTVKVTFVGGTDTLNIQSATGGTASLANFTKLGTGTLSLTGSTGAETLTGSSTGGTTITGAVGADVTTGGTGIDVYVIAQTGSNSTDGIDTISNFVGGTDVLNLDTTGAGTVNTGTANAGDVSNNAVAVASTGITVATLLANLTTAGAAQQVVSAGLFAQTGDTFSVQITGASLRGTDVFYVVQNDGANSTVTAADTIIALVGTSTAAITVATIL